MNTTTLKFMMRVKDENLRNSYVKFREYLISTTTLKKSTVTARLCILRQLIEDLNFYEMSWELLHEISKDKKRNLIERQILMRLLLHFLLYLDENDNYHGTYKGKYKENNETIRSLLNYSLANFEESFDSQKTCPQSIVEWRSKDVKIVSVIKSKMYFCSQFFSNI
jgi:hypothetical protein